MTRAILFDASRLYLGGGLPTPRGIDRADLDYARNLIDTWPGEVFALLPTPWGTRLFGRALFRKAIDFLETRWQERGDAEHDAGLAWVRRRLAGHGDPAPVRAWRRSSFPLADFFAGAWALIGVTGWHFGAPARSAPEGAIYLNIGHLAYVSPFFELLLRRRPDLRAVYLLHDVIPLEFPEMVLPIAVRLEHLMLWQVRHHAAGLIFNTAAAKAPVLSMLGLERHPATVTIPCPLAPAFEIREPEDATLRAENYVIVCGAIEPRKNHAVLLRAWQRLLQTHGKTAPRLLVVGPVARMGAPVLAMLRADVATRDHIIIVSGLTSPSVRRLIAHARGLLMPSLAEGFGLPVIEALSQDTPVLAADTAVMREVGGAHVRYLDPHDDAAWADAVVALADAPQPPPPGFQTMTREGYFAAVHQFLQSLP